MSKRAVSLKARLNAVPNEAVLLLKQPAKNNASTGPYLVLDRALLDSLEADRVNTARDEKFRLTARWLHGEDGVCEIDPHAVVSYSEQGAYVQAWVWVYTSDLPRSKPKRAKKKR